MILGALVIAVCLLVYPSFTDSISAARQTVVIRGFSEKADDLSEETIFSLKESAEKFNEMICSRQSMIPFRYEGESYDDPLYDAQLAVSVLSSVMAYIEIPFTGAYIPVVHGTRSEDLSFQAGHLYGTSLPWGGENTHCVIGAHTGLRGARLFDGLEKIETGENVYLHVLNEVHIYTVREIRKVLPEDADLYLQIEKGRDLLTLYTCTPPAVNSHRLLVKCERTGSFMEERQQGETGQADSQNIMALLKACGCAALPLAVLVTGILYLRKRRKRDLK